MDFVPTERDLVYLIVLINIIVLVVKSVLTYKSKLQQIYEIKEKSFEQQMDLADSTFDYLEELAVDRVGDMLNELIHEEDIHFSNQKELLEMYISLQREHQLLSYKYAWVENKRDLKALYRKMIKRNGFHDKTGDALEKYIKQSFNTLFTESRNNIYDHMDSYPALKTTKATDRLPEAENKDIFRRLITGCIDMELENDKEIKKIEKSINFLPKLIGLIRKLFIKD